MKVLVFLALIALVSAFSESEYRYAFSTWTQRYNKIYSTEDFFHRYDVFKKNFDFVMTHDAAATGFNVSLNKFADLSITEFVSIFNGLKMNKMPMASLLTKSRVYIPDSVDWRTQGAVTPIKNQGQCGSCWSFSATGSSEAAHFFTTKSLVGLSEQNLVDCSQSQGNMGCNGGLMDYAFQYIISNQGIDTEASYPYTARDGTCRFNRANVGATLSSFTDVSSGDEMALATSIASRPTSVAIDASHSSFQFYTSGIYYEPACSSTQLDHGVLAIGYGAGYYLVKNSWGTDWGNAGYIQMSRNRNNNCGIATMASWPTA